MEENWKQILTARATQLVARWLFKGVLVVATYFEMKIDDSVVTQISIAVATGVIAYGIAKFEAWTHDKQKNDVEGKAKIEAANEMVSKIEAKAVTAVPAILAQEAANEVIKKAETQVISKPDK
jgi:hypothetical protein